MYNWEFDITNATKKGYALGKRLKRKQPMLRMVQWIVEGEDNIIYFYSSVDQKANFRLNKEISSIGRQMEMVAVKLGMEVPPPLHLRINSYGGSVFATFGSIDYIMKSKTPIYTYVDGCAASAGTIMSVCGEKRFMGENAYMLIHQLSSGMWGKYQELQDDMKNSDNLMKRIKEIYDAKTKIPKTKMDDLLKHDLWWDAKTCLKYGLVDEILT